MCPQVIWIYTHWEVSNLQLLSGQNTTAMYGTLLSGKIINIPFFFAEIWSYSDPSRSVLGQEHEGGGMSQSNCHTWL
jgi:hypothetical protein